ncbi:ABC transporter permease [Streptomyces triticagri]|uniref:ABC transporter permease n=1 Tax=Streptomyces triticagri TaxID=2293568 RepID=UPI0018F659CD|nr:ABC transporter permease [Streptomyces triticagri]
MTAPLTPPHQPPPNDPWGAPPPGGAVPPWAPQDHDDRDTADEVRDGVLVALGVTVSGVLLGLLWLWLAPRVPLVSNSEGVYLQDIEGEQAIGADGTFLLCGLLLGAISGAVVFLLRKKGGIAVAVGLAVGGLLASVVAWRFGIWLGPGSDVVARAKEAGIGEAFDAPLKLNAKGALLAWPVAALAVHLGVTALFGPRDPELIPGIPYPAYGQQGWAASMGHGHPGAGQPPAGQQAEPGDRSAAGGDTGERGKGWQRPPG